MYMLVVLWYLEDVLCFCFVFVLFLQEDYTLVIHLDEHYNQSSQGEMVFFDQKEVVGRPRSHYSRELNKDDEEELEEDEYGEQGTSPRLVHDAIGAVQPRTGRVVVFHCSVVHSFRPPRSDFKGVRTMLVVKTSSSEQAAKARILTQVGTTSAQCLSLWCSTARTDKTQKAWQGPGNFHKSTEIRC